MFLVAAVDGLVWTGPGVNDSRWPCARPTGMNMWRFRPALPARLPDLDRATEQAAGAAHQHPVADVGDIAPRAGANHGARTLTARAAR